MALSNSEIYRHKAVLKSEKSFSSNVVVLSVGIVAVHPYRQYISLTNGLIRQHKCSLIKFNTPAMFVVILKPSIRIALNLSKEALNLRRELKAPCTKTIIRIRFGTCM